MSRWHHRRVSLAGDRIVEPVAVLELKIGPLAVNEWMRAVAGHRPGPGLELCLGLAADLCSADSPKRSRSPEELRVFSDVELAARQEAVEPLGGNADVRLDHPLCV